MKILIVHRNTFFRVGLVQACSEAVEGCAVTAQPDMTEVAERIAVHRHDVAILEAQGDTRSVIQKARSREGATRFIVLLPPEDRSAALDWLRCGASAVILTDSEPGELANALQFCRTASIYLDRQIDVTALAAPKLAEADPLSCLSERELQVYRLFVDCVREGYRRPARTQPENGGFVPVEPDAQAPRLERC